MVLLRKIFFIVIATLAALLIADVGKYFIFPNIAVLKRKHPYKTAFMEYREETWVKKGMRRAAHYEWVPLAQISPYVVKAVIISEDDQFWSHDGFNFGAMKTALEKDIKKMKFNAGGSTISQQLAKNLYLSPAKDPIRKIKEAILTWRLERNLSKSRILELYLNVAEWGDGIFGIELAAQTNYGKHASELTARQAATLVTLLPNPRRYKANGNSRYVEAQSERIYQIMVRRGIVIQDYDDVIKESKESNPDDSGSTDDEQNKNNSTAMDGSR
jgi:monofunctional glycosyltransferase